MMKIISLFSLSRSLASSLPFLLMLLMLMMMMILTRSTHSIRDGEER